MLRTTLELDFATAENAETPHVVVYEKDDEDQTPLAIIYITYLLPTDKAEAAAQALIAHWPN